MKGKLCFSLLYGWFFKPLTAQLNRLALDGVYSNKVGRIGMQYNLIMD
jgi:hypothetical protein